MISWANVFLLKVFISCLMTDQEPGNSCFSKVASCALHLFCKVLIGSKRLSFKELRIICTYFEIFEWSFYNYQWFWSVTDWITLTNWVNFISWCWGISLASYFKVSLCFFAKFNSSDVEISSWDIKCQRLYLYSYKDNN